jgi:hypothetical protein
VVGVVAANAHNLEVGYVSCSLCTLIVSCSFIAYLPAVLLDFGECGHGGRCRAELSAVGNC